MLAGLFEAARLMPGTLSAPDGSLPLTLISGFLGAGKTTLLNRLLADPQGRRLAVLVNDFGRINIDAELVRSRTEDMISLANGCVCCTVSSDLTRTLIDLAQRPDPPDAIVLEASGLADPRGIAQVALSNPALRLDGVLTLVDALSEADCLQAESSRDPAVTANLERQLDAADLIVLTKTDLLDPDTVQAVRDRLHQRWPRTPMVQAMDGRLPPALVLGLDSAQDLRSGPPAPWAHTQAFESWVLQSDTPLDEVRLRTFLAELTPQLLRAKGVIHLRGQSGQRHVYQQVGRRASLAPEAPSGLSGPAVSPATSLKSSLVLIGLRGCLDADRLQSSFEQLRAAP